jgi:hypothetical protein
VPKIRNGNERTYENEGDRDAERQGDSRVGRKRGNRKAWGENI